MGRKVIRSKDLPCSLAKVTKGKRHTFTDNIICIGAILEIPHYNSILLKSLIMKLVHQENHMHIPLYNYLHVSVCVCVGGGGGHISSMKNGSSHTNCKSKFSERALSWNQHTDADSDCQFKFDNFLKQLFPGNHTVVLTLTVSVNLDFLKELLPENSHSGADLTASAAAPPQKTTTTTTTTTTSVSQFRIFKNCPLSPICF